MSLCLLGRRSLVLARGHLLLRIGPFPPPTFGAVQVIAAVNLTSYCSLAVYAQKYAYTVNIVQEQGADLKFEPDGVYRRRAMDHFPVGRSKCSDRLDKNSVNH